MLSADQLPIIKGLADGLRPDPILTCSEWADEHRMLDSRGSPEPGRWRTIRTPYLREIMDNFSILSPVIETVVMKGAQLGFTEIGNNLVGYVIHHAPGPGLFLQPSQDLANRNVRQKIDPMITGTPTLAERVPSKRSKDGGNTLEEKEFPGGIWLFKWASSTSGLRSSSIRYLVLDEIDEYAVEVGAADNQQGSPEDLARARTNAYGRRKKIFIPSTPTVEGRSRISALFEDSDRRYFMMPCPHCDAAIKFEFKMLQWEKNKYDGVRYHCQECAEPIEEWRKTWMLEEAERRNQAGDERYGWVPTNPENGNRRGYHINGLYSPVGFKSWGEIALEWDRAQGNREKLKTFINTVLAETWKELGDAPDWQRLYNRREDYPRNVVPRGALLLFAGVDVQKDRLEVEIKAYGRNFETWSIDYRVFLGDTSDEKSANSPFHELDKLLREQWPHEHAGVAIPLSRLAIDSGYNTQTVYRWTAKHPATRVMACKGQPTSAMLVASPKQVQVKSSGKKLEVGGAKLWNIGTHIAKAELYAWLKPEPPTDMSAGFPNGWHHYPQYDTEYFQQLCGEIQTVRMVKGRRVYAWETTRPRVEVLDCHILARAAAAAYGIDRFMDKHWLQIETNLGITLESTHINAVDIAQAEKPQPVQAQPARARRKSNYWNR
jgi:phage terminase large subunit GpA-like protein